MSRGNPFLPLICSKLICDKYAINIECLVFGSGPMHRREINSEDQPKFKCLFANGLRDCSALESKVVAGPRRCIGSGSYLSQITKIIVDRDPG